MLTLTLQHEHTVISDPGALANLYWNVDANGLASGSVDDADPINDAPLPLFPGQAPGPIWGVTPWGTDTWTSRLERGPRWGRTPWGSCVWTQGGHQSRINFETPPVHFGRVLVAIKAIDRAGNVQSGALAEAERVVNSTPLPPARFARTTGGSKRFDFRESPQLEVA